MSKNNTLADYLDLEWFLKQDQDLDRATLKARDRALGLKAQEQNLQPADYFSLWLKEQRLATQAPLPSTWWQGIKKLSTVLLVCAGLVGGFSLVGGLLQYFGIYPVNVSVFLLAAVGPQLLLSLLALFFILRAFLTAKITLPWLSRPVLALSQLVSARFSGADFLRSQLLSQRYAPLLAREVMVLIQGSAVCFALGTLVGLLGSVAVTDLAFGWQSTLSSGAKGIYAVVSIFSWPWSWLPLSWNLAPGWEQIEGSRIILKDGISSLASTDLVSWWPFLSLCLFTYALVPRVLLYILARKNLRTIQERFKHPDWARIIDRMQAPVLDLGAGSETSGPALPVMPPKSQKSGLSTPPVSSIALECVLIIPPELEGRVDDKILSSLVYEASGYDLSAVDALDLEVEAMDELASQWAGQHWLGSRQRYAFLIEAWQPPIRESLLALAHLGADQDNRLLYLILIGRPHKNQWITAPNATEVQVWTQAMATLAPLVVDIFTIPNTEEA